MKKQIVLLFIGLLTIGLIVFLGFDINKYRIKKVLDTSAYNYLPKEAKNYIESVYKKTGDILLTEKNKEDNIPFLNPNYINYLSLSSEERQNVGSIPETLITEFNENTIEAKNIIISNDNTIPTSFTLRDYNGDGNTTDNYVTPQKNQSSTNLCWAFATNAVVESHLLLKNKTPYSSDAEIFSERQIDYSLSNNGITNYTNDLGYRSLTSGGTMYPTMIMYALGYLGVHNSYMPFSLSTNTIPLYKALNYGNSNYELNKYEKVPEMMSYSNEAAFNNYKNVIKSRIMLYGGAYVATESPDKPCTAANSLDPALSRVIRQDDTCTAGYNHAMQIIGWDDNYNYKYCIDGNSHARYFDDSCTAENTVTGTGAWILKNSWGNTLSTVYLAYDSKAYEVNFIEDLVSMNDRNWDTSYGKQHIEGDSYVISSNDSVIFTKKYNNPEKLQKVKVLVTSSNATYNLSLIDGDVTTPLGTISTILPGVITLDLSNKNIIINNSSFTIKISNTSGYQVLKKSLMAFTKNVNTDVTMDNYNYEFTENPDKSNAAYYSRPMYYKTANMLSNSTIEYKLFDYKGNDVSDYLNIHDNIIASNGMNLDFNLIPSIPAGVYTMQEKYSTSYQNTSKIIISNMSGNGTETSPYIITSASQLPMLSAYPGAYYKLGNDITIISTDDFDSISNFSGAFDGNFHTISGLTKPLFKDLKTSNNNDVKISNLTLKDININSTNTVVGALADKLYDYESETPSTYTFNINNISLIDGTVSSTNNTSGALIGEINTNNTNLIINSIYSNVTVSGTTAGLFGKITNQNNDLENNLVRITNVQNMGNIDVTSVNNPISYNYGFIIGKLSAHVSLLKGIVSGKFINNSASVVNYDAIVGTNNGTVINEESVVGDIYYVNGTYSTGRIQSLTPGAPSIPAKKTISELKNSELYSLTSWTDFNTYWNMPVINSISRIPILKNRTIEYTDLNLPAEGVVLVEGTKVSFSNYALPNKEFAKDFSCQSNDTSVVKADNNCVLTAFSPGNTTLYAINNYDGFNKVINVTVIKSDKSVVTFNANGGIGTMEDLVVNNDQDKALTQNIFTKPGYSFVHWNTKSDNSGTSYEDEETINISDSVELYAIWEANTYTIKYNSNQGVGNITSQSVAYDEEVTIKANTFTKTGYKFVKWRTTIDSVAREFTAEQVVSNLTISNNATITLSAMWTPIKYKIKYESNALEGDPIFANATYNSRFTIRTNTFTKTGYEFDSWNLKNDGSGNSFKGGSQAMNLTATEDEIVSLYATWKPIKYNIVFNSNTSSLEKTTLEATYDKVSKAPANTFNNNGYIFNGWNTKADGTGTDFIVNEELINLSTVAGDTFNIYAKWLEAQYSIIYNSNGGTGLMDSKIAKYTEDFKIKANTFQKENYHFYEWNTKADGTGKSYSENQSVSKLSGINNDIVNLYAIWRADVALKVKTYTFNETSNIIDKVPASSNLVSYKKSLEVAEGYTLKVYKNSTLLINTDLISTGCVTKIYQDSTLIKTITNIVRGDINGDGKTSALDYVKVRNHIMKKTMLNDKIYSTAADANMDGKISALDYVRIRNVIMKGK